MSYKVQRLFIDSVDRTRGDTNDFTIRFGNNFTLENVESILLSDASIPVSWYNITAENCTFYWNELTFGVAEAGVSPDQNALLNQYTFTIAVGNYTVASLITAVENAWNVEIAIIEPSSGVSITFDTTTNKFNIAFTGTYYNGYYDTGIIYSVGDIFDSVYFARYLPNQDMEKTLNGVMGFTASTGLVGRPTGDGTTLASAYRNMASGSVNYSSNKLHTVYGMEYIYITCDVVQGSLTSSANNAFNRILQKIPINSYFSELQFSQTGLHQEPVPVASSSFSEMTFRIVNRDNTLIDLFNGNVSFTIMIKYKENSYSYDVILFI